MCDLFTLSIAKLELVYRDKKLNVAVTRIAKSYENPNIRPKFIVAELKNRVSDNSRVSSTNKKNNAKVKI